jgi:4-amino-4-deoxy-L-arabinose transferase-like glycosyltransferase
LIGASIAAAGIPEIPFQSLDWSQTVAWNMQHGFQLNPAALLAARIPIAILAVVACLALYWLNVMVSSWWQALLAAVLFASNSAMLMLGRWAMLDVPALCFSLLTIALVVRVVQALRSGQNSLRWATLAGVMCGLAVGSKLIAVTLVAPAVLALLYEALRGQWKDRSIGYGAFVCVLLLMIWTTLVFYVSNPLLYKQPIAGAFQMLEFLQVIQRVNTFSPTPTLIERILAVWESLKAFGMLSRIGLPIDQILVLVGCLAIGIDLWRIPALRQQHPLDIVAIWMVGSTLIITISLPASIDRYLLPLQPIAAFLQAYGTIWVARRAVMLVRKRFGSVSTTNAPNTY